MTKSKVSSSHWGARPHGKTIGYGVKMKGQKKTHEIHHSFGWFFLKRKWIIIWYSNLSILEVKFFLFWESPKAPKAKRSSAQTWESWGNRLHMTSSPQQNRRPKVRLVREVCVQWSFGFSTGLNAEQLLVTTLVFCTWAPMLACTWRLPTCEIWCC